MIVEVLFDISAFYITVRQTISFPVLTDSVYKAGSIIKVSTSSFSKEHRKREISLGLPMKNDMLDSSLEH